MGPEPEGRVRRVLIYTQTAPGAAVDMDVVPAGLLRRLALHILELLDVQYEEDGLMDALVAFLGVSFVVIATPRP